MAAANLPVDTEMIYEGDFSEKSGQLGTHYFLDLPKPPTAVICNNDRMAIGAMRAVQARGLMVGADVSVVGFDDIPMARYGNPPLTTLSQPIHDIGIALFKLLSLASMENLPMHWGERCLSLNSLCANRR